MSSSDRQGKDRPSGPGRGAHPDRPTERRETNVDEEAIVGAGSNEPLVEAEAEAEAEVESTLEHINDPNSEESRIADEFLKQWTAGSGEMEAPFELEAEGATVSPAETEGEAEEAADRTKKKRKGGLFERLQSDKQKEAEARAHELEKQLQERDEKIREQEALLQKHYESRLRVQADFENYKKRVAKEREEIVQYGTERLLKEVLPFLDNLERALDHARTAGETGPLIEGLKITLNQVLQALKRHGLEPFDSLGQIFDPQRHEAMGQVESSEHLPSTILEEYQKGYLLWKRLLRPAMVSVARQPVQREPPPPPPAEIVELPCSEVPSPGASTEGSSPAEGNLDQPGGSSPDDEEMSAPDAAKRADAETAAGRGTKNGGRDRGPTNAE